MRTSANDRANKLDISPSAARAPAGSSFDKISVAARLPGTPGIGPPPPFAASSVFECLPGVGPAASGLSSRELCFELLVSNSVLIDRSETGGLRGLAPAYAR